VDSFDGCLEPPFFSCLLSLNFLYLVLGPVYTYCVHVHNHAKMNYSRILSNDMTTAKPHVRAVVSNVSSLYICYRNNDSMARQKYIFFTTSTAKLCSLVFARRCNLDRLRRLARGGAELLDLLHNLHRIVVRNTAKDDVSAIEPAGHNGGDEELGAVGILSGIGHGEDAGLGVLEFEVLVIELIAINGLATSTVALGKVTTLKHEVRDNAMESRARIAIAFFASAELFEVIRGVGNDVLEKMEIDAAGRLAVDIHIEPAVRRFFVF